MTLEKIVIEYNNLKIYIRDIEASYILSSDKFISIRYIGQWDESVITSVSLSESSDFINETRKSLQNWDNTFSSPGNNKRRADMITELRIILIDNVVVEIASSGYSTQKLL